MKLKKHKFRIRRPAVIIGLLFIVNALVFGSFWYTKQLEMNSALADARQIAKAVDERIAAIEAKKKEPVYITLPGAETIQVIVEDYNNPSSMWVLVNKTRPIPTDYVPANLVVPNVPTRMDKGVDERSVRQEIVKPIEDMFGAAKADGHDLMIGSAYRPASLQAFYFNSYVATSGRELAEQYSAHPGHSEHQLGLTVDISTVSRECYLSECFITTPDGQWLAKNAYKFGFILRYDKGKESITGYQYEPWHYRYVGVPLATALFESGLTLEEAWPHIEKALETLKENRAIEP